VSATVRGRVLSAVARWWWPATGGAVVLAWTAVALAGTTRVPPLAAAAAAGTALLAMAAPAGRADPAAVATLVAVPLAVAEAARGGNAVPLGVALATAALLAAYRRGVGRSAPLPLLTLSGGVAAVIVGVAAGSTNSDRILLRVGDRPAGALVLAGAALVVSAVDDQRGTERAVAAPVLLAALLATAVVPPLVLIAAWGALACVAALVDRPAVALAGLAIVATAAGARPAGLLLAAGATLAWSMDASAAAVCVLPGGVVLAGVLAGEPITAVSAAAALALGGAGVALLIRFRPEIRIDGGRPLALAFAAWFVVAPGSWAFSRADSLHAYDVGAARAVAAACLAMVALLFRRGAEWTWPTAAPPPAFADPFSGRPAAAMRSAAAVATVASAGWLVISVLRLH
jgi:hypothetical protein